MTDYKMDLSGTLSFSGSLNVKLTTVEELLDTLPLSTEIRQMLRDHVEVRDALKVINQTRFIPINGISVVHNPNLVGVVETIGIFTLDKDRRHKLKQDYLMKQNDGSWILFTGILKKKFKSTQYIQHVKTLPKRYGPDGRNYLKNHHPKLKDLDPKLQVAINEVLSLLES